MTATGGKKAQLKPTGCQNPPTDNFSLKYYFNSAGNSARNRTSILYPQESISFQNHHLDR